MTGGARRRLIAGGVRDAKFVVSLSARAVATLLAGIAFGLTALSLAPTLVGYRAALVTSGSMEPLIGVGDVVLIDDEHPTVRAGDVVPVDDPGRAMPLLHRVRKIDGSTIVTRGDANATDDATRARPDQIVGVARIVVPVIGWPILFSDAHPTAGPVFLVGSVGAFLLDWGRRMRRRTHRHARRRLVGAA